MMKKQLFLFLLALFCVTTSWASHMIGGAIYWKCHTNGQFQFFMELYRDCTGIQFTFENEEIQIVGNPLPTNGITSITLKPDSMRWLNANNGNVEIPCNQSKGGDRYTCPAGDQGTVHVFYYQSDLLTIEGVPPSSGWKFSWMAPCCRPSDISNVNTMGRILLLAEMFPSASNQNTMSCFDSSPEFVAPTRVMFCRGEKSYIDYGLAEDQDLDSIVYHFDRPYNPPANNPYVLSYKSGYSPQNPTPDTSFDIRNEASVLDATSGLLSFNVFSGTGISKYIVVTRADAYREGVKIASVYREAPLAMLNCTPLLPSGQKNNSPQLIFNGVSTNLYALDVIAGQNITVRIEAIDSDLSGPLNDLQGLTLSTSGSMYTQDYTAATPCDLSGRTSCAFLQNASLVLDTTVMPPAYTAKGIGNLSTELVWQTDCSHLDADGSSKTYYFYYRVQDDHCPIPLQTNGAIQITVHPNTQAIQPTIDCVTRLGNAHRITWSESIGRTSGFVGVDVFGSSQPNQGFVQIGSRITDSTINYIDDAALGHQYYYMQVSYVNCDSSVGISQPSTTVSLFNSNLSVTNETNCFQLVWDKQSLGTKTVVYREHPKGSGFVKIDSVYDASEYCDEFLNCSDSIFYYVVHSNSNAFCDQQSEIERLKGGVIPVNKGLTLVNGVFTAGSSTAKYQWYNCTKDSIVEGEVNQVFVPTDTGTYAVILTQYGCLDTSVCIPFYPVGLNERLLKGNVNIFPNPTRGEFTIEFPRQEGKVEVKVWNTRGQLVQRELYQNRKVLELRLKGEAGVYFVELINEKGESANLKLIKY